MKNPFKGTDWKDIVRSVAPTLATALGGPLAGAAVREMAENVLGDKDASEETVAAAIIGANPETLLKLREVDYAFKTKLVDAGVKLEELAASDRNSARRREIDAKDSMTPRVLALVVVAGWFLIQWYLLQHIIDDGMREIIMRTLGTLDMALGMILGYYFGSSASSAAKTATIAEVVTGRTPQ